MTKEYLDYVSSGSRRMQQMINDLLAYSRAGKELSPFTEVDANKVVETAVENLRAAITESKAQIKVNHLPHIFGSETQLTQLFQNLIGNAIKFRLSNSVPFIEIKAEPHGKGCQFSIRDNGIGIDAKYLEKIFVVFQRLHPPQKYPGTGIGLSICKRIVEQHGGKMRVESTLGSGSCFYFSFPSSVVTCEPPGESHLLKVEPVEQSLEK
jgi:light-regulated signal transduction histidine kinase (bacteriophytochrome)